MMVASVKRMLLYVGSAALLLLVLAVGAWLYVMKGVERPAYDVVFGDGALEVRAYPALVVAEVVKSGDRWSAVRAGFGPLAGYIFAREREGDRIAMTAPVTQRAGADGASWSVQFIMPSRYALGELPLPASTDVALRDVPARRRAAIRFSGVATDEAIAEHEGRLRAWIAEKGLRAEGAPIYAYYDDPMTPGFLRRNEVLFDLVE